MKIGLKNLTLKNILKVACDYEKVNPATECRENIKRAVTYLHETIDKIFNNDENIEDYFIYGVSTGFGEFKKKKLKEKSQLKSLQENILISHSVGIGEYLTEEVVRTTILLRINTFLKGYSGVRIELIEKLCEILNGRIYPLVPEKGSLGASGDLAPMAHLFATLLGKGNLRINKDTTINGVQLKKGDYKTSDLIKKGAFKPIELSYKEGLALVNGTTVSTAIGLIELKKVYDLLIYADISGSMSLESIMGCTRAFDLPVHKLRNMKGQIKTAENILKLIEGSTLVNQSGEVQDIYSVRCIPQVHGASKDTAYFTGETLINEANAVTDNPLFIFDKDYVPFDKKNQIKHYSAGNFHGQPVAFALDYLAIAVAEIGNIAERRIQMLLDKNFNNILPPCLTLRPGVYSGLGMVQYTSASLVSENKGLAHPASVDSIPTSSNAEDHVSMANWSARKLAAIVKNVKYILAMEFLCAYQALNFRTGILEKEAAKGRPGSGTGFMYEKLKNTIEPIVEDREFYLDIEKIYSLISSDKTIKELENLLHFHLI